MKMKFSCHFIFLIIWLCALPINARVNIIGSRVINVPAPVFKMSLDSAMENIQSMAFVMSNIQKYAYAATADADADTEDDNDDDDHLNLNLAITQCADVLSSTYEALNWSLSTIHEATKGYKQYNSADDVIFYARTRLETNLGRQKTCMEMFDGTKYSMLVQSFKQLTTSTQELLGMVQLQVRYRPLDARAGAGLKFKQSPDITVSQDGSGRFRRIMDAIAAAPSFSQNYFVILVKKGVYKENVHVDSSKSKLVLIGEGMEVTTISGSKCNGTGWSTMDSATFSVAADGFIAMDIGFENTAGPGKGQAVALLSSGDRTAFYRCKISGYQDSLLVHVGRQFYRDCQISGTVDFIFGYGTAVFQNCEIVVKKNKDGVSVITANGRNAPNDLSGFSFQFCKISADSNSVEGYLGRPWGKCARTIFMETYMSNVIMPQGWYDMRGGSAGATLYYGEYMNTGPGAEVKDRVTWPGFREISRPSEATVFTSAKFIDGNKWLPSTGIPYTKGLRN